MALTSENSEKPDEVNAWLDNENGDRAADLILKADDYTETVKLPATKPGWMERKHVYTAGGEELEDWDGPEVKENKNAFELVYEKLLLNLKVTIPLTLLNKYGASQSDFIAQGPQVFIGYSQDLFFTSCRSFTYSYMGDPYVYLDDYSGTEDYWENIFDTLAGFTTRYFGLIVNTDSGYPYGCVDVYKNSLLKKITLTYRGTYYEIEINNPVRISAESATTAEGVSIISPLFIGVNQQELDDDLMNLLRNGKNITFMLEEG